MTFANRTNSFSFYVNENGKYIKCYDLSNVSEEELSVSFEKINTTISIERKKIKNELWSNMTMVVSKEGKMHVDYDYTNLSEGTYQFKKNWKKKYLI
ncbi:immunity protein YezG family protein [Ruminococcus flavefaciens]|uniref:immunity protein YezG family protein n=1 Tax=Ruminococcus flavefaciens TaxID=1265 RepID=UPI0009B819FC